MEAVYPSSTSALVRGRRARAPTPRLRHRTVPVTFAEIKEVDEESEETPVEQQTEERRRRPDVLDEGLVRQFVEFRRRRARRDLLRERADEPASHPPASRSPVSHSHSPPSHSPPSHKLAAVSRAGSEPSALHAPAGADT